MSLSEAEKAREYAKAFVALSEAFQHEGMTLEDARSEARAAAMLAMQLADGEEDTAREKCPLCGR